VGFACPGKFDAKKARGAKMNGEAGEVGFLVDFFEKETPEG